MQRYIKTDNGKYLIRGSWTVAELKQQYVSFQEKYPTSKLSFDEWLVERGKVYYKERESTKSSRRGSLKGIDYQDTYKKYAEAVHANPELIEGLFHALRSAWNKEGNLQSIPARNALKTFAENVGITLANAVHFVREFALHKGDLEEVHRQRFKESQMPQVTNTKQVTRRRSGRSEVKALKGPVHESLTHREKALLHEVDHYSDGLSIHDIHDKEALKSLFQKGYLERSHQGRVRSLGMAGFEDQPVKKSLMPRVMNTKQATKKIAMTLEEARKECALMGFTLLKREGEYIVKPKGALVDDPRTYFTDDLNDAVGTAKLMRQEMNQSGSQGVKSRESRTVKTKQAVGGVSRKRNSMGTRRAKLDIMTGFSGIKDPDADEGLDGQGYFPKWTTVGLPDQGRNKSIDDDQQPTGSGAPETSFPKNPLKVPMDPDDVKRPRIREGREAAQHKLRRVASEIRLLQPVLARRLLAAADELAYDDLSTGALPVAGDEPNEVDDSQDQGHGTLSFFGTDPARSTSLTRKSSRRVQANPCEVVKRGEGWILVDDRGEKVGGPYDDKKDAEKAKLRFVEKEVEGVEKEEEREGKLEFASRRRATGEDGGGKDINLNNTLKLVKEALEGKYDKRSVLGIFDADCRRIRSLLTGGDTTPQEATAGHLSGGDRRSSRRRVANVGWGDVVKMAAILAHAGLAPETLTPMEVAQVLKVGAEAGKQLYPYVKKAMTMAGGQMGTGSPGQSTVQPGEQQQQVQPQQQASRHSKKRRKEQCVSSGQKRARAQGDKPLKPEAANPEDDGLGADGAGAFYRETKAPLQKSMNADDVKRPRIRENPEASKSLWAAFKQAITKKGDVGGTWNDGRYTIASRDYGNTMEIRASVQDREGVEYPVGEMTISVLNDSPSGRFASVELNDGLIENRVLELTMKPRTASRIISWIYDEGKDRSKATLEHVG